MMRSCRSMISRLLSIELPARQQPAWRADVYFPDHANVGQSFERLHERALKADSDVSGTQDPLAISAQARPAVRHLRGLSLRPYRLGAVCGAWFAFGGRAGAYQLARFGISVI